MNKNSIKCKQCGQTFKAVRKDAKFCCSSCRYKYWASKNQTIINVTDYENEKLKHLVKAETFEDEDIDYLNNHKHAIKRLYLLSNKDLIHEMIYELGLFSENEYADISVLLEKSMSILERIEENPTDISFLKSEISNIIVEYENLGNDYE